MESKLDSILNDPEKMKSAFEMASKIMGQNGAPAPPPEVDSDIAVFELKKELPDPELARLLNGLVKVAFAQRRKQLGKVLGQMFGKAETASAFENLNIPMEIRPDKLEVADFVAIARQLQSQEDKKNG